MSGFGRPTGPALNALLMLLTAVLLLIATVSGQVSKPGGAGHALLFRNHILIKKDFKNFPTDALTFEAWISSSDVCNTGTIVSYAKDSKAEDTATRTADFNHFVIFDHRNVVACHDFQYIDLLPDPMHQSCRASYANATGSRETANLAERDGGWHHLAVTWSTEDQGLTKIYVDGLLMSKAYTQRTQPLQPGGAFMLGGEQDCFGGCTDPKQGFNGLMDEVRIWRTVRTQKEILSNMRLASGPVGHNSFDLVAYWKFDDADSDEGQFRVHTQAADESRYVNPLQLQTPPRIAPAVIRTHDSSNTLSTGAMSLRNNFAVNKNVNGMPDKSFTVEMWAKGPALGPPNVEMSKRETLLSYSTQQLDAAGLPNGFLDDGIRIERVQVDINPLQMFEPFWTTSTRGAIGVHINSNEHVDSLSDNTAWILFDSGWMDDAWHHIAVSWDQASGQVSLYMDGEAKVAFWRNDHGVVLERPPLAGGVEPHIAAGSERSSQGSLVLGQDQDCYGGCFQASKGFIGDLANVHVWRRVLTNDEIHRNMARENPESKDGLAALYIFSVSGTKPADGGPMLLAMDTSGGSNHLQLRSDPPQYMYSTAPLTLPDGRPVKPPKPGSGGYSLALSDEQVLIRPNFVDFPTTAITVEFWMWSVDGCREGVPFSYSAGSHEGRRDSWLDNAFLLFNYNSWGVSVMEDEGTLGDHLSGVSATDGNWHHVAVTWESSTGQVLLYDNGRPVWRVHRGEGRTLPSGGTLVIGREQDCIGGCFDSATGAAGDVQTVSDQEYGAQDFFGVMEEMRIWKVARTAHQIREGMDADNGRGPGGFTSAGFPDPHHPDLVAYYKFDEGQGFVAKDATGHGHELFLTKQPAQWEVTRWLSTCSNGVVEGLEECDDGDLIGGNGCSAQCKVEPGWVCTGSPSVCKKRDPSAPPQPSGSAPSPEHVPVHPDPEGDHPWPTPDSGRGGGDSGASSAGGDSPSPAEPHHTNRGVVVGLLVAGGVFLCVGLAFAAATRFVSRDQAIEVRRRLVDAADRVTGGRLFGGASGLGAVDPEMNRLLAPDFMSTSSAPGHPGAYQHIPPYWRPTQDHQSQLPDMEPAGPGRTL